MAFMSDVGNFFFGRKSRTEQVPRLEQDQIDMIMQLLQGAQPQAEQGQDFLSMILSQDPNLMQQFEAPAMRQFQEEIVPSIAERFSSTFGEGSQRSSAFTQALGKAGAGLSERLGAQRAGLGMQASQTALGRLQSLLGMQQQPRRETGLHAGTEGIIQSLVRSAPQAAGAFFGAS